MNAAARRRRQQRITPFRAGLILILIAVATTYWAFGGSLPWQSPYELRAVVASGNELHSRTPVRIAGVDVGKVEEVTRGPGGTAIVTLALEDNALPIHSDATLKVRPRIFLEGNFFVDLQPGSPAAPVVDSGHMIPITQTATPVQLDQVLSALQRSTRDDLTGVVHELATALGNGGAETLKRSVKHWAPTFTQGAIAAEAFRGRNQHDLSNFIADAERTTRALSSRSTQLADLVSGLDLTVEALASRRAQLEASLPELAGVIREAGPAFVTLNGLFPTARAFVREARPGLRAAPATLRLANPLLGQLQGLLAPAELPALISAGDPAIQSLARLQPHLRDLMTQLYPVTECARKIVLPTLKTKIADPPLGTGDPVYAELFHGWVGLASAYQNFDGDGHAVRYHAGFGDQMITTGKVAGLSEPLVGLTQEPLLGSRPKSPGHLPPTRADKACMNQDPPNLNAAETGPAEKVTKLP
ncbi:MAG: phospholipid/cholesterol/gamma-HCH transport system substrate-binding protein [Thermoleophilaceae bacterium]|nr:phospholipid/cholesterol/gamma-HCH transport system substrate-binding protein [Thermoleophilaceae bacterium]